MKKIITSIVIIIAVLGCVIGGFFYYRNNKVVYNNESATGNTAGNLNNGGLFCEYDGKIYFANPSDQNRLYVMNSDCTDARKLNDDSVASLNVCGNYIYYVKNNFSEETLGMIFRGQLFGVYRCDLKGKHPKALYDKLSGIISLSGNTLYYQHYDNDTNLSLWSTQIDGKNNKKIYDTPYTPSCIYNGKIYFSDTNGRHHIQVLDTKTNNITDFYNCNSYMATIEGNYAYYIDLDKDYTLVRLNTANRTLEQLFKPSNGKVINYNVYGNKIFFQVEGDATGLYRMNIDGTQVEYIAAGNITSIHCTSQYTFFTYFDDQTTLYRVPTSSPITQVEEIVVK
ncbi:MAG: DUF5050 domain-containing protein [Eubacteriales bacterium]|nr:DUF5050 domain-containing protein [Eubacteriales bacterium]